jgi:hypothetical protein
VVAPWAQPASTSAVATMATNLRTCTAVLPSVAASSNEQSPRLSPEARGGLSFARRARPIHLRWAGLLTSGWASRPPTLTLANLRSPEPSRARSPVASLGIAPRSQWRDRAGFAPASLLGLRRGATPPRATPEARYSIGADCTSGQFQWGTGPPISGIPSHLWGRTRGVADFSPAPYTSAREDRLRGRFAALALIGVLTGCTRVPAVPPPSSPDFIVRPVRSTTSPSPLVQVQSGSVQAVFPSSWEAAPLPEDRYPQQGFVASSSLEDWARAAGTVRGMEAFWIDIAKEGIPSDYYYLAARATLLGSLGRNRNCTPEARRVLIDDPPDLTGRRFSASDYVASANGVCRTTGQPTRWAYVVVAPGFGPIREVGIPNSGIYVVIAVVSGPRSQVLLQEMMNGARFGTTSISEFMQLATRLKKS